MCFIKAPKIDMPKVAAPMAPPPVQAPVISGQKATDDYLDGSGLRLGRSRQQSLKVARDGNPGLQLPNL